MYIAIAKENKIIEIVQNNDSKNEAMAIYGPNCWAFITDATAFFLYSEGAELGVEPIIEDGKIIGRNVYEIAEYLKK